MSYDEDARLIPQPVIARCAHYAHAGSVNASEEGCVTGGAGGWETVRNQDGKIDVNRGFFDKKGILKARGRTIRSANLIRCY